MRRNLYSTWLLTATLFVASLFCSTSAWASHAVGADLTYVCLGNNTYRFTLTFYRDCSGIAAPASFTATVNGCGNAAQNFTLSPLGACQQITPLCPTATSTCNGGAIQGVQQCFYTGTFTFATQCANWNISTSECCRNTIGTIPNSQSFDIFVEATLNNMNGLCNSSPDFTQPPVPYVCANQIFTYNHGVTDAEGDSLVYSLVNPLDGPFPGAVINYGAGFTPLSPLSTSAPGVVFSTTNGQMTFTPTTIGQTSVVAVLVKEYRNGVLISTVRRDIQIIVLDCGANVTPQIGAVTGVTGAQFTAQNNSGTFRICPGQTMSFSVTCTDGNAAQVLSVLSNAAANFPGAVVNITNGAGNTRIFNFTWTPTANSVGIRTLAIEVRDNNCPTYGFSVEGYTIAVQGVNASANVGTLCYGTPTVVRLTAQAQEVPGGQYQWSANPPVPGLPTLPTTQNITVTISQQTTFTVRYQDNNCNATDTVVVQAYGPVSAVPATVNGYCPTDAPIQLTASYNNPAPVPPAACTLGAIGQCTGAISNRSIIGTGTTNTLAGGGVGSPYQGFWHDGRLQMLLTAAELTANGVQAGLISGLRLNISQKNSTAPYLGWTIKMGCTTATSLNAGTGFLAGLSTVYTNASVTPILGLNNYPFQTPYRWDGVSSLVVEFCYDNTAFTAYDHVTTNTTTFTSVLYRRVDASTGCTMTGATATTTRPDIILANCPIVVPPAGVTYAWTVSPTTGGSLTNPAIANPRATVTAGTPNGSTIRYIVTGNDGRCTSRDTVIVNVNCNDTCVANAAAAPVTSAELTCTRTTLQLTAANSNNGGSGTLSYAWAGPVGGIQGSATAAVITVAQPGTYTVTVTNTVTTPAPGSCTSVATVVVTQNNIPPIVTLTPDIPVISCRDLTATLTATPNVPLSQYTYVWTAGGGGNATGFTGFTNMTSVAGTYTVVVTNTDNGCTASSSTPITRNTTVPVATILPSQNLNCTTTTVTLDASASTPAGVDFLWSGAATPPTLADIAPTRPITAANAGTHTVTVTIPSNGCTAMATRTVTLDTIRPVMTLTANTTALNCTVPIATLTATVVTGHTYAWSAGATPGAAPGNTATVSAAGTYTVTITDPTNGCTRSRTIVMTKNATPVTVSLASSASQITCGAGSVTLTATANPSAGVTYAWGGATPLGVNTATISSAGTYTVTVTLTASACTSTSAVVITAALGAPTPNIAPSTNLSCTTASVTLNASGSTPAGVTYLWDGGATTPTATFSTAGQHTVTITNPANGCTATAFRLISIDTITPAMTVSSNIPILTCNDPTATLTAAVPASITSPLFAWTGVASSTGNTAVVNAGGIYTVKVTNPANGCTRTRSITIIEDKTPPLPIIAPSSPILTCTNTPITLDATGSSPAAGVTYAWNGGSAIATNPVTTTGTYTVTVTITATGCTASTAIAVGQDLTLPAPSITASVPTLTCAVTSLTLTVTAGGSNYLWSAGAAPTAQPNVVTVVAPAATYTVTMTSATTGCTATASFAVPSNITPPVPTITTPQQLTCTLLSTTVTAGGGVSYAWSGGSTPTTDVNTFNSPNVYTVTVTSGTNGCTATKSVTVIQDITLPTVAITGAVAPQLTCAVVSTPLTASGANTYSWNTGAVTNPLNATTPGVYTVTGTTTANGCTKTATFTVVQDIVAPIPTISVDFQTITCAHPTATMTVGGLTTAQTFVWNGGLTTSPRAVTTAGTYTVTATTTANGCTASASMVIAIDNTAPTVTATSGSVLTCTTLSSALTASGANTYVWSNSSPTNPTTVNAIGTYTVTGTNTSNGCTSSTTVVVTNNLTPPTITIVAPDTVLTCVNLQQTISASGNGATYLWNATQVSSQAGGVATVVVPNTYIVTATGTNGCTATRAQIILQNITPPPLALVAINGNTNITCSTPTVTIQASGATDYLWSTGGIVPAITLAAPFADSSGVNTYTVTATSTSNGCTASQTVSVTYDTRLPTPTMTADVSVLNCTILSANITASGLGTDGYQWSGNITSATANTATVNSQDTYTVTVTSAVNGCTDTGTYTITQDIAPPPNALTPVLPINCIFPSRILSTVDNLDTYAWSGPVGGIISQINNTAEVIATGVYTVTITSAVNTCTATNSITVINDLVQPNINIVSNGVLDCQTTIVQLTATTNDAYQWSPNAQNANTPSVNITTGGVYTVTVTQTSNGCTNSASFTLTQDTIRPVLTIASDFLTVNCTNPVATITALPNDPNFTFAWNGTGTGVNNTYQATTGATYTVTATNTVNHCQNTASIAIAQDNNPPIVGITPSFPELNCTIQTLELTASGGGTYLWDNTTTSNPRTIGSAGIYTVTVTSGTNGCTASTPISILRSTTPPIITIAPPAVITCTDSIISLTASAVSGTIPATNIPSTSILGATPIMVLAPLRQLE